MDPQAPFLPAPLPYPETCVWYKYRAMVQPLLPQWDVGAKETDVGKLLANVTTGQIYIHLDRCSLMPTLSVCIRERKDVGVYFLR